MKGTDTGMTAMIYPNADYLLQLSCGYWKSQALFTAVEFDIFTIINQGKLTAKEISQAIRANERATEMLLNALVSLDLLTKLEGYYTNAAMLNCYLIK